MYGFLVLVLYLGAYEQQARSAADIVREFKAATEQAMKQEALALELLKLEPGHAEVVSMLVVRWRSMTGNGRAKEAASEIRQLLEEHPTIAGRNEVLFYHAWVLGLAGLDERTVNDALRATDELIRTVPSDSRAAALLVAIARGVTDEEHRLSIYRRIVKEFPNSFAAKLATGNIRKSESIGKPFKLAFQDLESGRKVNVEELHGRVVVIHFWATTCGPCITEIRGELKQVLAAHSRDQVECIGVNLDSGRDYESKVKRFIATNKVSWPQFATGKSFEGEFASSWGIDAIPAVFIIDRDGKLATTAAHGKIQTTLAQLLKPAQ